MACARVASTRSLNPSRDLFPSPRQNQQACDAMTATTELSAGPWEVSALRYEYPPIMDDDQDNTVRYKTPLRMAPVIPPGLYSATSFDVMHVLVSLYARPNKTVDIGSVDTNCALVICDLQKPDHPIVYASPTFLDMTGYMLPEVMGRNCRFLQAPGGKVSPKSPRQYVEKEVLQQMRSAVEKNEEIMICVTNFRKNGQKFRNTLAIIPLRWQGSEYDISVGLLTDL